MSHKLTPNQAAWLEINEDALRQRLHRAAFRADRAKRALQAVKITGRLNLAWAKVYVLAHSSITFYQRQINEQRAALHQPLLKADQLRRSLSI